MNLAHAADLAYAASGPPVNGGAAGMMQFILPFAMMFAILYFIVLRPQQRQKTVREKMLSALKKGDRVVMVYSQVRAYVIEAEQTLLKRRTVSR